VHLGIIESERKQLQRLRVALGNTHFHPDRDALDYAFGHCYRKPLTDADTLRERHRFVQPDAEPEYRRIFVRVRELITGGYDLELGAGEYAVCHSVRQSNQCAGHHAPATSATPAATPADRGQRGRHAEL
jgi:hypothetical protein